MNYNKIYNLLITRARLEEETRLLRKLNGEYMEKHHIIPRCMGGDNFDINLVYLLPEEHFTAHLLLTKIYSNVYNLFLSVQIMIGNGKYKKNNKSYGNIKRSIQLIKKELGMPQETKDKISKSKLGVPLSDSHKENLSKARKGRSWEDLLGIEEAASFRKQRSQSRGPLSELTKTNISTAKKGISPHVWTDEMKLKTSNTMSGKKKSDEHKAKLKEFHSIEKTCPHCNKTGTGPSMQRWHFNHCKNKGTTDVTN